VLRPGERFYAVATNVGTSAARVELDVRRARGLRLVGVGASHVPAQQWQAFELQHIVGADLGGLLVARSRDGLRQEWWERASWQQKEFRLPGPVRIRAERWICGSPALVFPPGVRMQYARFWNDAEQERPYYADTPAGYRVLNFGTPIDRTPPQVGVGAALELVVQPLPRGQGGMPDTTWTPEPDREAVPLIRLESARREVGADVIVGIDFGTRNTSVRVRWRRTLTPVKPEGTVDVVGDRVGSARFPTEMVVHLRERHFLWGSEADAYIQTNRLADDEFPVENLKTNLREGDEPFIEKYGKDYTCANLVARYFEQVFARLDAYFGTADPALPLTRESLQIRYVMTRPVLDANEGDIKGRVYEQALVAALARCGVEEGQITFVHEPVAAAIGIAKRREQELLGLQGQAVAVVDAGGGTTDVALARVQLQNGRVALDVVGSYALQLQPNNPAHAALKWFGLSDRVEVGGNVLDCGLAYQLLAAADSLLETDARPVPRHLEFMPPQEEGTAALQAARSREPLLICRRMKERFARFSKQYLNRPRNQPPAAGEVLPFANRPEYEGIYLEHELVDRHLFVPVLNPVVEDLSERMGRAQSATEGVRPSQVRRVFYVGGTNIDGFVRQRFGRAFPGAVAETDADAQSDERIAERLHAVVEGAIWFDEQLYAPSPLTLTVRLGSLERPSQEQTLVAAGAALLPAALAQTRFLTTILEVQEELDAALIAADGGLAESTCVARGFYRNEEDTAQEVTLRVAVSRERGATALLTVGTRLLDQWRFMLVEARV
jgi:hypothetical protein